MRFNLTGRLVEHPSSKSIMLEKMWRKGDPPTLLVGMKMGTTTTANNMGVSLKTKNSSILVKKPPYCSP